MQTVGRQLGKGTSAPTFLEQLGMLEKLPAAVCFGAVLALSSPGLDIWWLAWVGLVPLILLARSSKSVTESLVIGFAYGMAYHLVCHRWILELHPLTAFQIHDVLSLSGVALLWLLESAHQSILVAIFAVFAYALPVRAGILPHIRRPFFPFILSLPIVGVFLQWIVAPAEPFAGLPVNQLAYSQVKLLPLIQICSIGGAPLLDLLLLAANCAVAALLMEFLPFLTPGPAERIDRLSPKWGVLIDLVIVAFAVSSCWSFGEWRLKRVAELPPYSSDPYDKEAYNPAVPLAVLQGNVPVRPEKFRLLTAQEPVERYTSLSTPVGAAMLVLPEAVLRLDEGPGKLLASRLRGVCAAEKKEVIAGALETLNSSLVNVVRLITDQPVQDCFYIKNRLLPFVESVPFKALAAAVPENLFRLLPSSKNNFLVAPSPYLLASCWGNVGASVSFEVAYPELIAQEVENGAALLVNVCDLSWFHHTSLGSQLLAAASIRAVENGRYLVLASNTGISGIINPLGIVTSRSPAGQAGTILDRVQFLYKRTQFTRLWWLWRPGYRFIWH